MEGDEGWHVGFATVTRDEMRTCGREKVSNAQLQGPLLLTGTRDLCNYVDAVSGRLCWKDTKDGCRGV